LSVVTAAAARVFHERESRTDRGANTRHGSSPQVCGYEKDSMDSIAGYDGRVIECLQDYKEELSNDQCKTSVHKLTERAAQDIRMDRPLADACYEDRKRLCEAVSPGSARVLRCLQDSREQLSYECRATLFDQEVCSPLPLSPPPAIDRWPRSSALRRLLVAVYVSTPCGTELRVFVLWCVGAGRHWQVRLAEDIDFKFPMKKACAKEITSFCKDVPHGHARIISCLQVSARARPACHMYTYLKRGVRGVS